MLATVRVESRSLMSALLSSSVRYIRGEKSKVSRRHEHKDAAGRAESHKLPYVCLISELLSAGRLLWAFSFSVSSLLHVSNNRSKAASLSSFLRACISS